MKKYKVIQWVQEGRNEVIVLADFAEVADGLLQFGVFDSLNENNIVAMFKDWSHFSEIP